MKVNGDFFLRFDCYSCNKITRTLELFVGFGVIHFGKKSQICMIQT